MGRILHFNQRARAAIARCYDKCKPLTRFSILESDELWTLADELMQMEAERRGDPEWEKRPQESEDAPLVALKGGR